jgi:hypothetical protein
MNIVLVGYGIKDFVFYSSLKRMKNWSFKLKLQYHVPFILSPLYVFYNRQLAKDCFNNLPTTFSERSILSLPSICCYVGYLRKSIINSDAIILQGRDRYFEFVAFFLARRFNKRIYFFESAFPGYIYLSLNGVSGDANLLQSIPQDFEEFYPDADLPIIEYFKFAFSQIFAFGHRLEFNFIYNKIINMVKINNLYATTSSNIYNSVIFLGQVESDVNHKKFGIPLPQIESFIYSKFGDCRKYLKFHPREPVNHVNEYLFNTIDNLKPLNCNLLELVGKNNIFITVNSTSALEIKYLYPDEVIFVLGNSFFEKFVSNNRELNNCKNIVNYLIPSGYRLGRNYFSFNFKRSLENVL